MKSKCAAGGTITEPTPLRSELFGCIGVEAEVVSGAHVSIRDGRRVPLQCRVSGVLVEGL